MKTGIVLILLLLACLHGALTAFGAGVLTQHYEYDGNGRLIAVTVPENPLLNERYRYDGSGNLVEKQLGERIYRMSYDGAHQLKSQEGPEGFRAFYYDKAGRLVRETLEGKTVVEYRYGYLDKVVEVIRDGERAEFFYDGTGMLAGKRVNGEYEAWTWDGLALVARGDERYVNEGHVSGGVPVLSHSREGVRYHQTDILGTTLATYTADGKMEPVLASAFGADMGFGSLTGTHRFTGKPYDRHLGAHVFPYRNYDSSVARWRSSDPAGFPDGPNGHFYAAVPTVEVDVLGLLITHYGASPENISKFNADMINLRDNGGALGRSLYNAAMDASTDLKVYWGPDYNATSSLSTHDDNPIMRLNSEHDYYLGPGNLEGIGPSEIPNTSATVVGHEFGHNLIGLDDPANVLLVENILRSAFGDVVRETKQGVDITGYIPSQEDVNRLNAFIQIWEF